MKQLFTGNPEDLKNNLWSLDLEPIMVKLMDPKEGKGWSESQTFIAVEEYRRFLFLTLTRNGSDRSENLYRCRLARSYSRYGEIPGRLPEPIRFFPGSLPIFRFTRRRRP